MEEEHQKLKQTGIYTDNVKISNQSNAIPSLSLHISKSSSDFVTEQINLTSSGWDMDEAKEGIRYLLEQYKGLSKDESNTN